MESLVKAIFNYRFVSNYCLICSSSEGHCDCGEVDKMTSEIMKLSYLHHRVGYWDLPDHLKPARIEFDEDIRNIVNQGDLPPS